MRTAADLDVAGKRVLVRSDLNVPLDDTGKITDDGRIRASVPLLRDLLDRGAAVVVTAHLGRPKGAPDPAYSLAPVAQRLEELLGAPVRIAQDVVGESAQEVVTALEPGRIALLENVRFEAAETSKDDAERGALADRLASFADLYVDDAFGAVHRKHASVFDVAERLPHAAGPLVAAEVDVLRRLTESPERDYVVVLGGSKVSDKLKVIEALLPKVDRLLVGGGMCFTFLAAQGHQVGSSLLESDQLDVCRAFLETGKVVLPVDVVAASAFSADAAHDVVAVDAIPADRMGLDIGPRSVTVFADALAGGAHRLLERPDGGVRDGPLRRGHPRGRRGGRGAVLGRRGRAHRRRRRRLRRGRPRAGHRRGPLHPHQHRWWGEPGVPRGQAAARDRGARVSRQPLMAGNWKMNLNHLQAIGLVQKLAFSLSPKDLDAVEVAVLPPFVDLRSVQTLVDGDGLRIAYGAQDLSEHDEGAYTGEVSGAMLAKLGCRYVVIGHSERRQYHREDDALVNRKVQAAVKHGLTPILCVGEGLDVRELNGQVDHCIGQLERALEGVPAEAVRSMVIAYEPVWAIGTGKVATPADAQEVCGEVRLTVSQLYPGETADQVRVLYGGSVKSSNVVELMQQPDVDGALVGGASLDADEFAKVCRFPSL